jgi:hypothetical protein
MFGLIMVVFAGFFAIATLVNFLLYRDLKHKPTERFTAWMVLSCYLRFLQGLLATYATFQLVMNSASVIEIILNFSAINFISDLDDKAFFLVQEGLWGTPLQKKTEEIQQECLPCFMFGYDKENKFWAYWIMIGIVFAIILGFAVPTLHFQLDDDLWNTQALRLEFLGPRLKSFSACYDAKGVENRKRKIYSTNITNITGIANIGYCEDKRQWFLFNNESTAYDINNVDPCEASETRLAYSSKTDFFDISTIFDKDWYYSGNAFDGNTPLDMYFVPFERDIEQNCAQYNDGICDSIMNQFKYKYDGGDCCGSTCLNSNCGSISEMRNVSDSNGNLIDISVFNNNTLIESGISFPYCSNPDMHPITVRLNNVTSDADLLITCDDRDFLSVRIKEDMVNESETIMVPAETIMVPDGANCTITIANITVDDKKLYIDYTVFHGDISKESINEDPIVIVQAYVDVNKTINADTTTIQTDFTRIPDCYLGISPIEYLYPTRSFYPNCVEPEMVNITLRFDSVSNTSTYILNCDERTALLVDVNTTMENKTKTVQIKDGAFCTMTIENKYINEPNSNITYNYTGYTVFQGNNTSIEIDSILILRDTSNAKTISTSFQMIPSCFPNSNIYKENYPSFKANQFIISEGYLNCDDITFQKNTKKPFPLMIAH